MNKIQKRKLYESIMRSVSKTVKKKLNEAYDSFETNSYGYKWCINNGEDPDQEIVLYSAYDEATDTTEPFAIVRTAYDDYYRITPELRDYLRRKDDLPILRCEGQFKMSQLDKKTLDAYDAGYIYDLEYSDGHVCRYD